ncbi:winged helix-turn-helix domain-containing protein [Marinicella sp. S1101]|nr:winged helix-turn-helix domain-containing protein [Marinicella marina]
MTHSGFYLGAWLVQPKQNQLTKAGVAQTIEPKLMEVLLHLSLKSPEVVSTDELVTNCWPNQYISDNPVHKCVAQLRKALGDDARKPSYIKTIPKKGYAIIAAVKGFDRPNAMVRPTWLNGPPYLGSKPYQESHKSIFFGRQKASSEIKKIIDKLNFNETHALLILGAQKAGKTSLINTEIVPFLKNPVKPLSHPFCGFIQHSINASDEAMALSLQQTLKAHIDIGAGADFTNAYPHEQAKFLLVLDQFEQVVINKEAAEITAFFACLNQLMADKKFFIISLIANEYYADLMRQEGFQKYKKAAVSYDLIPPNDDEIKQIIKQPVAAAGLRFEYDKTCFESLSEHITRDAENLNNALPVISQAMRHLCLQVNDHNQFTFHAYRKMGRLSGFLAHKAEAVFDVCEAHQVEAFKKYLNHLIRVNNEGVKQLSQCDLATINDTDAMIVINQLIDADIISTQMHEQQTYITLVHQSLLSESPTIRSWLNANQLQLSIKTNLQTQAHWWIKNNKQNDYLLDNTYLLDQADTLNLNNNERAFIKKSKAKVHQKHRIKQFFAATILLLLASVSVLLVKNQNINQALLVSQTSAEALNNFLIKDLKQKLYPIGQLNLLEMLSTKVIAHYKNQKNPSTTTQMHHIEALNTLAEVHINQGRWQDAHKHLTLAQQKLTDLQAQTTETTYLLSQTQYWLGYIDYLQKDFQQAQGFWLEYLHQAQQLMQAEPNNKQWQLELSYALNNMGSLKLKMFELDAAATFFNQSANLKQQLVNQHPDELQYLADYSDTVSWLATSKSRNNQLNDANMLYARSLQLAEQLFQTESDNKIWQHRLALANYRLSLSHYDLGQLQQAKNHGDRAAQLFTELTKADQDNQNWRGTLIKTNTLLAKISRHSGDIDQAQLFNNQALNLFQQFPQSVQKLKNRQLQQVETENIRILSALGQHKAAWDRFTRIFKATTNHKDVLNHVELQLLQYQLQSAVSQGEASTLVLAQTELSQFIAANKHNRIALALAKQLSSQLGQPLDKGQVAYLNGIEFKNPDFLTEI